MGFRRLKSLFDKVEWKGVVFKGTDVMLVNGSAHYGQIVKVGNQYSKTEYTHLYPDNSLMSTIYEATIPLSRREIIRLRHHFTQRIWMLDGVFECIDWQVLNKEPEPKKGKLLPPFMCYNCMLEGNKYIPKQIKIDGNGQCRCCGNKQTNFHATCRGWPIDLRHKGFVFTVISSGRNWEMNKEYYRRNFDMSIYSDYTG